MRTCRPRRHQRLPDVAGDGRLLRIVQRTHAVACQQSERMVARAERFQTVELARLDAGRRDDLVLVDRIGDPLQRLMRAALGILHHGRTVVVGETAAMRIDQRAHEFDEPALACHRQHHRIFADPGRLDLQRLLDQLVPGLRRRLDAGLLQLGGVIEERHVVGVVGQAVLLALVLHRCEAEILGIGVVLGQLRITVDRRQPARVGPFGQPAIGHPHHVQRRLAHELGDHALAVLCPRRIAVVDLHAGLGLERRQVALDRIDRRRPRLVVQRPPLRLALD